VNDLPSSRREPGTERLTLCTLVSIGEKCRCIEAPDPATLASVSLHRTFHDDFGAHPLLNERWTPHCAGGAAWPAARYRGGDGSEIKVAYQIDER
jgi:hypothetical protein